jgi:16S rRNA (guanine527-N7)-methyltransferase
VNFADELQRFLPVDLPNREALVVKGARHLEMIAEVNQSFNLTRIVDPIEAAIKHTVDSVIPWKLFSTSKPKVVADAGSGAGFPGIPLAIVLPEIEFVLLESTQKKARFIESAVEALGLKNVDVLPDRAEDWLRSNRPSIVTARAVAPLIRALPLFMPAMKRGSRILLYKGRDIENEIDELKQKDQPLVHVLQHYELPEMLGSRTIVELSVQAPRRTTK